MPVDPVHTLYYRRARFATRLPKKYRYAPSHYWLLEVEPGLFRVGLTKFATRMLGDFVEREIQTPVGEMIEVGQTIGWIEGFKAVADVYSVACGKLAGVNEKLDQQPNLVDKDCYDGAWLYMVEGEPAENCLDCEGYQAALDRAIHRMLEQQKQQEQKKC